MEARGDGDARDLELAELSAGGDRDAFEQLVRRHERAVFRLAYNVCGNAHDAEDAAQEAFLRLYRKIGTFRGESKFTTWLHRLTLNVALNYKRRVVDRAGSMTEPLERDEGDTPLELHDTGPGPEQLALRAERGAMIRRAVDSLPGEYREAFVLREIAELDYAEIAEIQATGQGTVKSRLFRARERIRQFLAENGFDREHLT